MDEFTRELEAPPAVQWKYDPNPLVGLLVSRYTFDGGTYEPCEMLIVQPEGSETAFSVLCGKTVLRSFIENKDPQVGGKVGLKYRGLVTSGSGTEYEDFASAYEPPEQMDRFDRELERGGDDEELPF